MSTFRYQNIAFAIFFVVFLSGCTSVQDATHNIEDIPEEFVNLESQVDNHPEQRWSMKEWYENLPSEYSMSKKVSSNNKDPYWVKESEILDENNFYYKQMGTVKNSGDPAVSSADITLTVFIANNGERTLVVSRDICRMGCRSNVDFLHYNNGEWKNISDSIPGVAKNDVIKSKIRKWDVFDEFFMSKIKEGTLCDHLFRLSIILPRYGTTIDFEWICPNKEEKYSIAELKWNSKTATFRLKKKY